MRIEQLRRALEDAELSFVDTLPVFVKLDYIVGCDLAAEYLGVSRITVMSYGKRGILHPWRVGNKHRYWIAELDRVQVGKGGPWK